MALISCPECGHKVSDKAAVCPSCGCPVEFAIKQMKAKEKKYVHQYRVLNKQFNIDENLDRYLHIILEVDQKRCNFDDLIRKRYAEYTDIDDLYERLPDLISESLAQLLEYAIHTLTKYGIYEYDAARFMEKYADEIDVESVFSPLTDQYLKILDLDDEIESYHESIRNYRKNYWSGGGFSVGGAIEGHIKAQLMNAGNTVIHALQDSAARSKDKSIVDTQKAKLFKDSYGIVIDAMDEIFDTFIEAITIELANGGKIDIYNFNTSKADSILNNYDNIPADNILAALAEAFFADPTFYPTIQCIVELYPEEFEGIVKYAKDYGYYDRIVEEEKHDLEIDCWKKIADIYEEKDIAENSTLKEILDLCFEMTESDINADRFIKEAITRRLQNSFDEKDAKEIKEYLYSNNVDSWPKHLLNTVLKSINERVEQNQELVELSSVVKKICDTWKIGFFDDDVYLESKNLYEMPDYNRYIEGLEISKSTKIYALYGSCTFDQYKDVKYAFAITDGGLYAYNGLSKIFCNWKDFATIPFSDNRYGIIIGDEYIKLYTYDTIYKLLIAIRNAIQNVLENKRKSKFTDNEKKEELNNEKRATIVKNVCKKYAEKRHSSLHQYGFDKDLRYSENYAKCQKSLNVSAYADIYYLYKEEDQEYDFLRYCTIISSKGLDMKDGRGRKLHIDWKEFENVSISVNDDTIIVEGKEIDSYDHKSACYIAQLLIEIKAELLKKDYTVLNSKPNKTNDSVDNLYGELYEGYYKEEQKNNPVENYKLEEKEKNQEKQRDNCVISTPSSEQTNDLGKDLYGDIYDELYEGYYNTEQNGKPTVSNKGDIITPSSEQAHDLTEGFDSKKIDSITEQQKELILRFVTIISHKIDSTTKQQEEPLYYCSNCGKQMKQGDLFCSYCGTKRQTVSETNIKQNDVGIKSRGIFQSLSREKMTELLKLRLPQFAKYDTYYFQENMRMKSINTALKCYGRGLSLQDVIAFYDTTVFEGGKRGYIFTEDAIYAKSIMEDPFSIKYSEIENIDFEDQEDKKDVLILIKIRGDDNILVINDNFLNKKMFGLFLRDVLEQSK